MLITIPYTPFNYQVKYHRHPTRFKVCAGGRRSGKSYCLLHDCIRKCLSLPSQLVWWVSPTLGDAREVGFEMFKELIPTLDPAIQYINDTRMMIRFTNKSTLYFKGAEKERALRGRGLNHVAIDEAAFIHPDIWRKALRPALTDKRGTAHLASTTNGRNWFFELYKIVGYDDSREKKNAWSRYHWPTSTNPLIEPDEIEAAKNELSDIDFRQEYLAEFVTRAGLVYEDFGVENEIEPIKIEEYHDVYLGADFGYANFTAIPFIAVDNRTGNVTIFDEIYERRTSIEAISKKIVQVLRRNGLSKSDVRRIYTDPAGNAEELTSGTSPVDYLRMEEGYVVENKGTKIIYGLHLMRSYIRAADGTRRLFVTKNCKNTISSLSGYTYDKQYLSDTYKEEPLKDGIHDHMCDGVRYFFVNRFDKSKWITKHLDCQSYLSPQEKKLSMKRCSTCRRPFPSRTRKTEPPYLCKECLGEEANADE